MASVDLYCERTSADLWSEPINALTNAAFLLAAALAWRLVRRTSSLAPGIGLLLALAAAIGLGSFVFHTVATTWARALDVVPILLFQMAFLWIYGREMLGLGRPAAGAIVAVFLLAALFGRQFPHILNGSLSYAPALAVMLALGLYHDRTTRHARYALYGASGLMAAALLFRTVDDAICSAMPIGTHFLWHLSIAGVVYLSMRALIVNLPITSPRKP